MLPSVAGLIDRANVSADNTNANEYTNAIERFTSEYELYCQDVASGLIKDEDGDDVPDNMDASQGRVYNVTKVKNRFDITALESPSGNRGSYINRDTKYPLNNETLKLIIQNYTKTSSATFEPKQSDCSYWYNPDCGIVVVAKTDASKKRLNSLVVSGVDAKGNKLNDENANWINISIATDIVENTGNAFVFGAIYQTDFVYNYDAATKRILIFNHDKTISVFTYYYDKITLEFVEEKLNQALPLELLEYNEDNTVCVFNNSITITASNNGKTITLTSDSEDNLILNLATQ